MQTIILAVIFLLALAYIINMVVKQVRPKKGSCGANCKCGVNADAMIDAAAKR